MSGEILSRRPLNRALLARQMLLRRSPLSAPEAIEHLVGLQAQSPLAPYVGLWSRLEKFRHEDLAELIAERQAVRIGLMRNTIHLVTSGDALKLWPVLRPVMARAFAGSGSGRNLPGIDIEALLAAGRAHLQKTPRTAQQLGNLLRQQWPDRDPELLARAIRFLEPVAQVPPRGIWGAGGQATWATLEDWLGRPVLPGGTDENLVLRYLAAFGPASVADMQTWSGLTRLAEVVQRLRPELKNFRDEDGRELFDLPDAPRPDPGTPAPPRFLPEYDNLLLSHADRRRVIADEHRERVFTKGAFLVDGFVRGTWKIARQSATAMLVIEPFKALSKKDAAALTREGARLLAFAAANAAPRDIQIVAPHIADPPATAPTV
jgi:hypothetical protein